MKIVRFEADRTVQYGVWEGEVVRGLEGTPFRQFKFSGRIYSLGEVKLLSPCIPTKVVAAGLNYKSHIEEVGAKTPLAPILVLKPPTSVIGPEDKIVYPDSSQHLDYEGELAVVIKKKAYRISPEEAPKYILGYLCINDVTARDLQRQDRQWTRSKAFDTFCPLGPCIETDLDPGNANLETWRNGELKQKANTSDLLFGVPQLVSFITHIMTMLPGDVVATGTPKGISELQVGDTIEVKIEGIGTLRNYVAKQG